MISIDQIITDVCSELGVSRELLADCTRDRRVVVARWLVTHIARRFTALSYPAIAIAIGKAHSTLITGHKALLRIIGQGGWCNVGRGRPRIDVTVAIRNVESRLASHRA